MSRLEFSNGIVLEEVDEGLLVQHGAEAYIARNINRDVVYSVLRFVSGL